MVVMALTINTHLQLSPTFGGNIAYRNADFGLHNERPMITIVVEWNNRSSISFVPNAGGGDEQWEQTTLRMRTG
jgi:hypothetical protein